jgi:hypothetical protein
MTFGFGWYYKITQARITTLTENAAKLEVAIDAAEASITLLENEAVKNAELQKNLTVQLQEAESYGDSLRKKLRELDLLGDAMRDAANLEGRMNGATANLWRDIMGETGNDDGGKRDLPQWLQRDTGAGSTGSDGGTENNSTDSSSPETD